MGIMDDVNQRIAALEEKISYLTGCVETLANALYRVFGDEAPVNNMKQIAREIIGSEIRDKAQAHGEEDGTSAGED